MIDEFARIKDIARDEGRREGRYEGRYEGRQEGIVKGIDKGETNLAALVNKLFALNRIEDVKKVAEDAEYRKQLMKEFAIC